MLWNDWFIDVGYGEHADRKEAERFVRIFSSMYGAEFESEISQAFFSNSNASFRTGSYKIEYTYNRGPKIDERLLIAIPYQIEEKKEKTIRDSASDFDACRVATSKAAGYAESLLSGDGEPAKENGYASYFILGKNKDQFFCEVHPGRHYKIKAALNGRYPFRHIAEGEL